MKGKTDSQSEQSGDEKVFHGIRVSSGLSVGRAYLKAPHDDHIVQRVLDAGVPSSTEAQKRIQRIRLEHWLLF